MFSTGYVALLVDDEPDVLEVSKLAMKNFRVFGSRIKLHTATSKAEAMKLYDSVLTTQDGQCAVAVAFIDVVMESDSAGLELCRYIREEKGNLETQIFVRTGQPGTAPERSVIDRYNISGYFTKVEATDDKLYSLTVSGVRQFEVLSTGRVISQLTNAVVAAKSREEIAGILNFVVQALPSDATGQAHQLVDPRVAFLIDGDIVARHPTLSEQEIAAARASLASAPGVPLSDDGDRYLIDGQRFVLQVAGGPDRAEVTYVAPIPGEVPPTFPAQMHALARPLATLWKRAGS